MDLPTIQILDYVTIASAQWEGSPRRLKALPARFDGPPRGIIDVIRKMSAFEIYASRAVESELTPYIQVVDPVKKISLVSCKSIGSSAIIDSLSQLSKFGTPGRKIFSRNVGHY